MARKSIDSIGKSTRMSLKKVVILGPESTGKSTLSAALAEHFQTYWCQEYAREYLLKNGNKYSLEQLTEIAKGQLALEDAYTQKAIDEEKSLLFIDTDMQVMKVWSEYVFGTCDPFILEAHAERSYDLYLLCAPDLPWIADELREYPDEGPRKELFAIYSSHLAMQSTPWVVIRGIQEERTRMAIHAVEHHLMSS